MTTSLAIPPSTLDVVASCPPDAVVLLLLRHAARGLIPAGEPGNDVPLLPEGRVLARQFGATLGFRLGTIHTSPVPRCVETAEAIVDGANAKREIVQDRLLGDPGVYVVDPVVAWEAWRRLGNEGVMRALISGERLDGFAEPFSASQRLIDHLLARAGRDAGVHIFVSHDALIAVAAAHCLGLRSLADAVPEYLEALVLRRDGEHICAEYRHDARAIER